MDLLLLREVCLWFNIFLDLIIIKWKKDFVNFGLQGLKVKFKGRLKFMSDFKCKKFKFEKFLIREEEFFLENEVLCCEVDFLKKL